MTDFWPDLWRREEEFLASAKPEFRHGTAFVGVSTLAGQFYCEYKVENEFALGEIPTEAKETGTELHDELIPGVEVTAEDFARLVSGKKPSYAVLRVWGTVEASAWSGCPTTSSGPGGGRSGWSSSRQRRATPARSGRTRRTR